MAVNISTDSATAVMDEVDAGQDAAQDVAVGGDGVDVGQFDPTLTEEQIQSAVDEFLGPVPPVAEVVAETAAETAAEVVPVTVDPVAELEKLRDELRFRTTFESELTGVSTAVEKAAAEVMRCESIVEEAKGDLKSAKEKYDQVVCELRVLTRDFAIGQWRLPFEGPTQAPTQTSAVNSADMVPATISGDTEIKLPKVVDPAVSSPVSELGKKKLKEIVGADVFDNAKNIDEPIGLNDKQIEAIEGQDCQTIADLIKKLKAYPLFFHDIKGFGEKAQGRLSMSLAAWRKVHPEPVEPE